MPRNTHDDDLRLARRLLDAAGCKNIKVIQVMRTPAREGSSGVFKVELASKHDKIEVLRRKATLKQSHEFKNVYLRSSMSHIERLSQLNFKMLLSEIPQGKDFRITGNGRIIKKSDEGQDAMRSKSLRGSVQKNSPITTATVNKAPATTMVPNRHTSPGTSYSNVVQGAAGCTPHNHSVQSTDVRPHGVYQPRPLFHSQEIPPSGYSTCMTQQSAMSSTSPLYNAQTVQQLSQQPHMNSAMSNPENQFAWSQQTQGDFSYAHN